ncbi:MAG: hypothetical protein LAP86_04965 [Acidobacteriia bacterium]|nr:hypothetical protein [Terriglobia bacterium]
MQHCNGKTKSGSRCRAPAGASGLCFFHAHPEKAHTLGQIGGRKNRAQMPESPPASSLSAADLRGILVEAIHDVRSKKITARTAGALAQLCNSLHRVIQTADVEARIAELEQRLEQQSQTSVDADATGTHEQEEGCNGADAQPGDVYTPGSGDVTESTNDGSGKDGKA